MGKEILYLFIIVNIAGKKSNFIENYIETPKIKRP